MIGEKRLEACLLHNIDFAVVSECVCHLKARYLLQSPNMIGKVHITLINLKILFLFGIDYSSAMHDAFRMERSVCH